MKREPFFLSDDPLENLFRAYFQSKEKKVRLKQEILIDGEWVEIKSLDN